MSDPNAPAYPPSYPPSYPPTYAPAPGSVDSQAPWPPPNPYAIPARVEPRPDPAPPRYRLADPLTRLGANLLDNALWGVIFIPVLVGLIGALPFSDHGEDPKQIFFSVLKTLMGPLIITGLGTAFLTVYQAWRVSTTGQTIGKALLKIRVVAESGEPPSFVRFWLLRTFVPALLGGLPNVGWLFGTVDSLFIFRDDRKCVHDHIAKTRVVVVE